MYTNKTYEINIIFLLSLIKLVKIRSIEILLLLLMLFFIVVVDQRKKSLVRIRSVTAEDIPDMDRYRRAIVAWANVTLTQTWQ